MVKFTARDAHDLIVEICVRNDGNRRFPPSAEANPLGTDASLLRQVLEIGVTVAVIVVGVAVIRYYRQRMNEEPATTLDLMTDFQAAYEAGDLDFEEYSRVREALLGGVAPEKDKPPIEPEL
jgi:hypothetical protein